MYNKNQIKGMIKMSTIFIGGAREIKVLPEKVENRLKNIYNKNHSIVIGDANGIDKVVQQYFYNYKYSNIKIFASNGNARNNIGNWKVESIKVSSKLKGFDFYKEKDLAMAKVADIGFMIWNCKSKGTLNNMINLLTLNKELIVYLTVINSLKKIDNLDKLLNLLNKYAPDTITIYNALLLNSNKQLTLL